MIKVDRGLGPMGGSRWLWQCADCDYSSPYTTSVKRHIESKHVMAVLYQCDICLHKLPTKNALSVHKARNHNSSSEFNELMQWFYLIFLHTFE